MRLLLFLSLTQCAFVSNTYSWLKYFGLHLVQVRLKMAFDTNNVIRMEERDESQESQVKC